MSSMTEHTRCEAHPEEMKIKKLQGVMEYCLGFSMWRYMSFYGDESLKEKNIPSSDESDAIFLSDCYGT